MKDWYYSFAINSDPQGIVAEDETKARLTAVWETAQTLSVTKTLDTAGWPYRIGVDDDVGKRCDFWRDHADITRN
jgi:hypothetical protein